MFRCFFRVIFLPTVAFVFRSPGTSAHLRAIWRLSSSLLERPEIQCGTPKPSLRNAGGIYWITGDFWFLGSIRHINGGIFRKPKHPKTQMASVGLKSYPDGVAKGGCLGMLSMRFHHGNSWIVPSSSRNRTWFLSFASDAALTTLKIYILYIYIPWEIKMI